MLLERLRQNPKQSVDDKVDDFVFKKLMSNELEGQSTLDNANTVLAHLKNKWMKEDEGFHQAYSSRDTFFNVLLHFTSEVLAEKNLEPVCHYEHLLRWHNLSSFLGEDLLTVSFLASRDVYYRRHRYTFCWQPVIGHDNHALNEIFKRPMTELHFHLNGSSMNFDINWMSLMNKVSGWNESFKKLQKPQQDIFQTSDGLTNEPICLCAMKAAALRMLLFEYVIGGNSVGSVSSDDIEIAEKILYAETVDEAVPHVLKLDVITQRLRYVHGKRYSRLDGSLRVPDYATLDKHTNGINKDDTHYVLSVLSGERWLMYELFKDIYSHKNINKQIAGWFYAYLLYKSRFMSELVQNNSTIGFANFSNYEKRKNLFVKKGSVHDTLLCQLAVVSFLNTSENRKLELRIAPKDCRKDLIKHLRETRSFIGDGHFLTKEKNKDIANKYGIILHFIKAEDDKAKAQDIQLGKCRHYKLRYAVKRQAHAIVALRQSQSRYRDSVLGIDAANSEVFTRPEVFAQAFRYLRENTEEVRGLKMLPDLGMTYHVGEDYLDVADGLRAVDEVIQFLRFRDGDRLGHGIVLGVDVTEYYTRAHNSILLPSQVLLDNVVWLYCKGKNLPEFIPASKSLEILFETYFQEIYGHLKIHSTMWVYYLSWLLRGDNPQYYRSSNQPGKHAISSRWSMYNLNDNPEARKAAGNKQACSLYEAYHFDPTVREKGTQTVMVKLTDEVVAYIAAIQRMMLTEIEQRHICVECNPTSNLKIGHFDRYNTHPILRMYNDNLTIEEDPHSISVSINTDDKGIFATSLEREYSLLALSLEKEYAKDHKTPPRLIYDWLDRIREFGFEQKF